MPKYQRMAAICTVQRNLILLGMHASKPVTSLLGRSFGHQQPTAWRAAREGFARYLPIVQEAQELWTFRDSLSGATVSPAGISSRGARIANTLTSASSSFSTKCILRNYWYINLLHRYSIIRVYF